MCDFACKKNRTRVVFTLFLAIFLAIPAAIQALPVAVEQVENRYSLKHSAFFMIDKEGKSSILEASSPLRQNDYRRLEDGIPVNSKGTLWLRLSLIKNTQSTSASQPDTARVPLFIDLGTDASGERLYIAKKASASGNRENWIESLPLANGSFALPEPELLPLTVYVRVDGIPSLWFDPVLTRGDTTQGASDWTLFMQLGLGLALIVLFIRGMTRHEEWRFWAGSIVACAIIPALFGKYGSESHIIYLTAMPRLLAPGLAIMLMPHLGRHLLNSRGSKNLDYTLIALSLPGVIAALLPLVPGFNWTARLLPLAPLLLLPLVLIAMFKIRSGQSGTVLYFLFTLFPFIGAVLALLTLISPAFAPLKPMGPELCTFGYMLGSLILAFGKTEEIKETGDFFPLNEILDETLVVCHKVSNASPRAQRLAERPDELVDSPPLLLPKAAEPETDLVIYSCTELASVDNVQAPEKTELPKEDKKAQGPKFHDLGLDMSVFDRHEPAGINYNALPSKSAPKTEATAPVLVVPDYTEGVGRPRAIDSRESNNAKAEPDALHKAHAVAPALAEHDENIIYIKDEEEPGLVILKAAGPEPINGVEPVNSSPVYNWEYTAICRLENALRTPYDQLVKQLDELKSRQDLTADYLDNLGKSLNGLGLMLDNLERVARGEPLSQGKSQSIFNLAQMIRHIHEELLPLAEEHHITLSWFVAPGLPSHFRGQEQDISQAIRFLLQGTMEAASGGAVQLSVRQGVGPYSGQIQFTLQESSMQQGQSQRPSGWLNKAWELAAGSGGSFNIDFIQGKGMAITMALPLMPVTGNQTGETDVQRGEEILKMPGSAALAEFAPETTLEDEELPADSFVDDDEEVILLTETVSQKKNTADKTAQIGDSTPAPHLLNSEEEQPKEQPEDKPEIEVEVLAATDLDFAESPDEGFAAKYAASEVFQETEQPESKAETSPLLEPQKLIILEEDNYELSDIPPALTAEVSAPRPISKPDTPAPAITKQAKGLREYIIIADMAASGRRLILRRLEGLPHKLAEARSADEILKAVGKYPVGLIIIDADMPEIDVRHALEKTAEYNQRNGLPATPSLCLLSHESQTERMLRLGCTATQIKSASRVQFRQIVLRLCPHPKSSPEEMLPESPLLRSHTQEAPSAPYTAVQKQEEQAPAPVSNVLAAPAPNNWQPQGNVRTQAPSAATPPLAENAKPAWLQDKNEMPADKNSSKKNGRVPMLDLIVASLGEEENSQNSIQDKNNDTQKAQLKMPYPLSSPDGEFMEGEMVPLIPGLLVVLEESLGDLSQARVKPDAKEVQEISGRLAGQGNAFGLSTLERMARCVERAAEAEDVEAIRDFSDELLSLGRRYLGVLKSTHAEYSKKY